MAGSIIFQEIAQYAFAWVGMNRAGAIVGGYGPTAQDCRCRANALDVPVGDWSRFQVYQTPPELQIVAQRADSVRLRMILTVAGAEKEPVRG
ncbi:MAG: hypothetical protein AB1664_15635 [Thermodesulfobacteriota bacterium]